MADQGERDPHPIECWVAPDWRWSAVKRLLEDSPAWGGCWRNDPLIARAVEYCRSLADGRRQPRPNQQTTPIQWAVLLHDCPSMWQDLRIMVLADMPRSTMATRLCVSEEAIEAAELLFFDVRQRLEATSWVVARTIRPHEDDPAFVVRLRAAYFGGPTVAESILDTSQRAFLPGDENHAGFKLSLRLKVLAALELPAVDARSAARIFGLYERFTAQESRQQLASQRLQLGRQTAEHRQRAAKRRIETQLAMHHEKMEARRQAAALHDRFRGLRQQQREALALNRSQQQLAEQQAAAERAATSPLARLQWSVGADSTNQDSAAWPVADRSAPPSGCGDSSRTSGKIQKAARTAA